VKVESKSLIQFGSKAKSAVPGLIRALSDPEANVRQAARAALNQINPEAAANAGVK
jgi:HEAT repeat protein